MASITGIELGPDSCLLAGVRPARAGGAEVFALHRITAADWPADDDAVTDLLRAARRDTRLPRRASVVAWGLPDSAVDDEISRAALSPVEAAGFRITSILTPPQALAVLAATRPRNAPSEAAAWLALNTHGVAIAIVSGSELLFSRTFRWKYDPNLATGRAQLLQRYTLIAQLGPELRRGMDLVRKSHGLAVEAVVICGDLPELRSLTMPLIEELDLEVETLDSTEGLHAARNATLARFADLAPALRLVVAGALAPVSRSPRASNVSATMRIAAVIALLAALAWGASSYWNVSPARAARTIRPPQQMAGIRPPAASVRSPLPAPPLNRTPPSSVDEPKPLATVGTREPQPLPPPVARRESKPVPPPATASVEPKAPSAAIPLATPPLPKIDSVLIDQGRRLALIDGAIVGVGDTIGGRLVVQIDRDAVVLREPSGRIVRVRMRAPTAS